MTIQSINETKVAQSRTSSIAAGLGAILFGTFLLLGTGFLHSEIVHNAAHDVRHVNGFPCH